METSLVSKTKTTTKSILKSVLVAILVFGIGVGGFLGWNYLRQTGQLGIDPSTDRRWAAFQKLTEAKRLAAIDEHEAALAIFEELAKSEVGSVYGWNAEHLACASMGALGKYDASLERIQKLITDCPYPDQVSAARMSMANIHGMANQIDASRQIIDQIIAAYPQAAELCANALFTMSTVYQRHGVHASHWAALQRIAADYPGIENTALKVAQKAADDLVTIVRDQQEPIIRHMTTEGVTKPPAVTETTTKWTAEEGPYLIMDSFMVGAGSTLRIEAGTVVHFAVDGELRIEGTLDAVGTLDQPVRFIPLDEDPQRHWWRGIVVPRSPKPPTVSLAHCQILGAANGIYADSGKVTLDHCQFNRSARAGVLTSGDASLRMNHCEVLDSHRIGVEGTAKTDMQINACQIRRAKSHGIFLTEVTNKSVVRNTIIEECGAVGVLVRGRTQTTIDHCTIRANGLQGVHSLDGAAPSIIDSVITTNGAAGLRTEKRWDGLIARNQITDNVRGGIHAEARCAGEIVDNLITGNGQFGIRLRLNSNPTIERNQIAHNEGVGLWLQKDSLPTSLHTNLFVKNDAGALHNETNSAVDATDNWWDTTIQPQIEDLIKDHQDNEQWGPVTYAPWLTQAPPFDLSELVNE